MNYAEIGGFKSAIKLLSSQASQLPAFHAPVHNLKISVRIVYSVYL